MDQEVGDISPMVNQTFVFVRGQARLDVNQRPPEPHAQTDGRLQNNNQHFSVATRCHVPRQIRTLQQGKVQTWCNFIFSRTERNLTLRNFANPSL